MTQHELIIKYIEEYGSLLPAKIAAIVYKDQMFGSETSKRCRELRAKGILRSEGDGRFERFYLTNDREFKPVLSGKEFCCNENWTGKPHNPKCFNCKIEKPRKVEEINQQLIF